MKNNKEMYTPPCTEAIVLQLEQAVALSYNETDGTEVISVDPFFEL